MTLLVLLAVAGCGDPSRAEAPLGAVSAPPGTVSASAIRPFSTVTVIRTGGLAGDHTELTVDVDGGTTRSSNGEPQQTGQLPPPALDQLRELMTGAQIAAEAGAGSDRPPCPDSFTTEVRMGTLQVARDDCTDRHEQAPAYAEVLDLLSPYLR